MRAQKATIMNKVKFYFILSITTLSIFSCSKNDDDDYEPVREYAAQYPIDITDIGEYLNNYYITITNNPGQPDDQDVVMTKIAFGDTQPSIMSYLNAATYPKLLLRKVSIHDIEYKLYYLVLRPGTGESPSNVDEVLASYRGDYIYRTSPTSETPYEIKTTKFDEVKYPQDFISLFSHTRGWKEIFPQFKKGTSTINPDGSVSYNDFGAGVLFIPSGLGYYTGISSIPAYAPLIYSFKLYDIKRSDDEYVGAFGTSSYVSKADGVLSYLEDLDGDGYVWTASELPKGAVNPDDTDKDGIPDFLDEDDDGDNYSTKLEIKNPATGLPYPFASIPTCTSGVKNYLDATCH